MENQQKPKICPKCGSSALKYKDKEFMEGFVVYPWTCDTCKTKGNEVYDLKFRCQITE